MPSVAATRWHSIELTAVDAAWYQLTAACTSAHGAKPLPSLSLQRTPAPPRVSRQLVVSCDGSGQLRSGRLANPGVHWRRDQSAFLHTASSLEHVRATQHHSAMAAGFRCSRHDAGNAEQLIVPATINASRTAACSATTCHGTTMASRLWTHCKMAFV